jgi:hypothetical protein
MPATLPGGTRCSGEERSRIEHAARRTDTSQGEAGAGLHLNCDEETGLGARRDLRPWRRSPAGIARRRRRVQTPAARPPPLCPPDTGGARRRCVPDRATAGLRDRAVRGERQLRGRLARSGAARQSDHDCLGELPLPSFFLRPEASSLSFLHGSCRLLHGKGEDAFCAADWAIASRAKDMTSRPNASI